MMGSYDSSSFKVFLKNYSILCICVRVLVDMSLICTQVLVDAKRGHQISGTWSYR